MAATSAVYFDQYLRGLDSMASAIAHDKSVLSLRREACDQVLADLLRDQPLLLNAMIQASDGTIRGSGLPAGDRPLVALPHIRDVLTTGRPAVSELTVGPVSQKPTILFGYPVPFAGAGGSPPVGVLTLGLNLAGLESMFKAVPLADGSVVTLTNQRGLVLARSRDADRFIGTTMEIPKPASDSDSPFASVMTDLDGVERIVASAGVRGGAWTISVGIPRSVILARLWPLWTRNLLIVVVSALLSFLLSLGVGRHFARQLNHLREAAHRIAAGDLSPVSSTGAFNKELTELQSAFRTMAENLRATHQALDQQVAQEREIREALETIQRQAVRQERLAAVGLLVSGVAHELNNPLQAIMGASELLERHELSDQALKEVELVKNQGLRASEIIRSLSRFGAQRSAEPAIVDLHDVVAEVVQLRFADLDSAGISCEVDVAATGRIHVNFTEIEQVVLNFIVNAQYAIEAAKVANGRVVIRSSDAGPSVRLEVLDNGPGVPPGNEAKLFQPFFTTKPVGEGTGLGLSVSYGIIDSYGGTIGYRRNEWGRATVFFELPRLSPS